MFASLDKIALTCIMWSALTAHHRSTPDMLFTASGDNDKVLAQSLRNKVYVRIRPICHPTVYLSLIRAISIGFETPYGAVHLLALP